IGAAAGAIAFPSRELEALQVVRVTGFGRASTEINQRIYRDDPYTIAEVWRRGQPLFIPSRKALSNYPQLSPLAGSSRFEAWAAVPLMTERRLLGIMGMSFAEEHAFDEEECGFILALADVAAQAIDRAELYESERRIRSEAEAA